MITIKQLIFFFIHLGNFFFITGNVPKYCIRPEIRLGTDYTAYFRGIRAYLHKSFESILVFIEKEILLAGIIRPNIFHAFIYLAFIFHLLQVLNDFQRRA